MKLPVASPFFAFRYYLIAFVILSHTLIAVSTQAQLITSSVAQPELNGKTIRSIKYDLRPIFDEPDLGTFYKTANSLKVTTKSKVLKREVLFHEGDKYDEFTVRESERQLREQRFLTKVKISGVADGDSVDMMVTAQEAWTFVPQASFDAGGGSKKQSIGLADSDIFGYGKRAEILSRETDKRKELETVWDDPRVFGTKNRLLGAYFDRDDGQRFVGFVGRPFRYLLDKDSWTVDVEDANTVGRLYENGEEDYIFRQNQRDIKARFGWAIGDAKVFVQRFFVGANSLQSDFQQASQNDYDVLSLDPSVVSNDIGGLPQSRRYRGPTIGYQSIVPDYISMNYIDRFARVEDYNLGNETSADLFVAPRTLGSRGDSGQVSANESWGWKHSPLSFSRLEAGGTSRIQNNELEDSLLRAEYKYFNVLGDCFFSDFFFGRHTLAANAFVDYGNRLDRDRQFLIGADSGLRGYSARAFSGDKRLSVSVEDRMHFVDEALKIISIGGAVFFDGGGTSDNTVGDIINTRFYSDVGAGLRLGFPKSSGGGVIRLDVAVPLRDGPDGTNEGSPRFVVSAGQAFGARLRSETFGTEKANIEVGFTD